MEIELNNHADGLPPHGAAKIFSTGAGITKAKAAVVMMHGRGATARGILELTEYFRQPDILYLAPQAENNVWYPYSFLSPIHRNEPGLSSSLELISRIVDHLGKSGIPENNIALLGFSQGACVALEWTARTGRTISAVFGLSGGLIGSDVEMNQYRTLPGNTFAFLGCSDIDQHIPKERVLETARKFESLNADVSVKLYPNMGHTINQDEIEVISSHLDKLSGLA